MGRRPIVRPSGDADVLAGRLRELRARRDISAADKRRLELILREMGNLGGISLDDILNPGGPGGPILDPGTITGDFDGIEIRPVLLSNLIGEVAAEAPRGVDGLHFVTGTVLARLRAELPETLPTKPLPTGRKGAVLPVTSSALGTLVQLAALRRTEGEGRIVWDDGVNQLMVHAAKVRSVVTEGIVRISVPVECDQTRATMEIAFAVGSEKRVAGMIAATADRPAGDPLIARVWGEALIAFAYGALLDLADSLAGASGRDERNDRLVPRGLVARRGQLSVETQARFVYDRSEK
jgi:hypothetical protein